MKRLIGRVRDGPAAEGMEVDMGSSDMIDMNRWEVDELEISRTEPK